MELKPRKKPLIVVPSILLIVPYGIETFTWKHLVIFRYPFNRTLWN